MRFAWLLLVIHGPLCIEHQAFLEYLLQIFPIYGLSQVIYIVEQNATLSEANEHYYTPHVTTDIFCDDM